MNAKALLTSCCGLDTFVLYVQRQNIASAYIYLDANAGCGVGMFHILQSVY